MNEKYVSAEKIIGAGKGSVYKLAVLAAKRAMMMADGDKCLLDKPGEKVLNNAFREIEEGRIRVA